jgi:hypothetical protein
LYKSEEIVRELGTEELKRVAMDALISQDLDSIQCTGSNLVQLRRNLDPLYDIKSAEWGGVYPSSMLDIAFKRWKDEGTNNDQIAQEKILKMPMMFEMDPLITEELPDEL